MTRASSSRKQVPKSQFPWDNLTSNALNEIASQLGLSRQIRRKAEVIELLEKVAVNGLEATLEESREEPRPAVTKATTRSASFTRRSAKRKPEEDPLAESSGSLPYNTRHKGLKRVRVSAPPLRRRRPVTDGKPEKGTYESASAPTIPVSKRTRGRPPKNPKPSDVPSVERGRGRPRKYTNTASSSSVLKRKAVSQSPPKKMIFDGVVLKSRFSTIPSQAYTEDDDADGESDEGDDEHLVVVRNGETSSLASSNKENEGPALIADENHAPQPSSQPINHSDIPDGTNMLIDNTPGPRSLINNGLGAGSLINNGVGAGSLINNDSTDAGPFNGVGAGSLINNDGGGF